MASFIGSAADDAVVVGVHYSIATGEVLSMTVGSICFVDKVRGILKPGWKRAMAKQAFRFPAMRDLAFWSDDLQGVYDKMLEAQEGR